MEISIHSRNVNITTRLRNYIEKKTARLDRYLPNLSEIRVDLAEESTKSAVERQIAQITVRDNRGTILRAEERSSDMFAAVDAVIDKLYKQIRRYRGKRRRYWRGGNAATNEEFLGEPLPLEEEEEEAVQKIVRVKSFPMQPMSPEEAIDQIELLGHDFFVFLNTENNAVNVLYRRRDENYGLLQPELD